MFGSRAPQYKIGDKVILGKHAIESTWMEDMESYVGREATIMLLYNVYEDHGPAYMVDVDNRRHYWLEDFMNPAVQQTVHSTKSGAACSKCREWNEYQPANQPFTCYRCSH